MIIKFIFLGLFLYFLFSFLFSFSLRKKQTSPSQKIKQQLQNAASEFQVVPFSENPWNDPAFSKRYTLLVNETQLWGEGLEDIERLQTLFPQAALDILDLGCGSGRHAHLLANVGHSVVGVEQCAEAVKRAKSQEKQNQNKNVEFYQKEVLLFETDRRFDLILILCALPLNLSPEILQQWLEKSLKWLKPGGTIVLDLPHKIPSPKEYIFWDDPPLWSDKPCWILNKTELLFEQNLVLDSFFCCTSKGRLLTNHSVTRKYHQISEITQLAPKALELKVDSPPSAKQSSWILLTSR